MLSKFWAFAKVFLIFILFSLVVALVWWGGPEIRLGESRPLDPPFWRLFVIFIFFLAIAFPTFWRILSSWVARLHLVKLSSNDAHINPIETSCRELLRALQIQERRHSESLTQRFLACSTFSSIDFLIQVADSEASSWLNHWPYLIEWDSGETLSGRIIISQNRSWLFLKLDAIVIWSDVLKRHLNVRSFIAIASPDAYTTNETHLAFIDESLKTLKIWQQQTQRTLPVWLISSSRGSDEPSLAALEALPWGFCFPKSLTKSLSAFKYSKQIFLNALRVELSSPEFIPQATQKLLLNINICENELDFLPSSLIRLNRHGMVRGIFWVLKTSSSKYSNLRPTLEAVLADQCKSQWTYRPRLLGWIFLFLLIIGSSRIAIDFTIIRSERHLAVQQNWVNAIPDLMSTKIKVNNSTATLTHMISSLNNLEQLEIESSEVLNEQLPKYMLDFIDQLKKTWVVDGLMPSLHSNNVEHISNLASPDDKDLYHGLAFGRMIDDPTHQNLNLILLTLTSWNLTQEQQSSILHHLQNRYESVAPTQLIEYLKWKKILISQAAYTLDKRIWDGILYEMPPSNADNFNLTKSMGTGSAWFENKDEVPWIFTYAGLHEGFRPSSQRYKQWGKEYQWVIWDEDKDLSRDELDSLGLQLRLKYAKEAIKNWNNWFSKLTIVPSSDLTDMLARTQLFASEESPLIQLLSALENAMPLPIKRSTSLYDRFWNRVMDDWSRIQYEFGWRRNARRSLDAFDPSLKIGQSFIQLQIFFPDDKGKSAARDRLLVTIGGIAAYLEKILISKQLELPHPDNAVLVGLKTKANKLPSPLKEITLEMASSTESQVQRNLSQSLSQVLSELPTYQNCKLGMDFPFNSESVTDLAWSDFVQDFSPQGRLAQANNIFGKSNQFNADKIADTRKTIVPSVLHDPAWLEYATYLGKAWFPRVGSGLKFSINPVFLSPSIRMLKIRFGSEVWIFAHGQENMQWLNWPPENGLMAIEMEVTTVSNEIHKTKLKGPWALLRWARQAKEQSMEDPSKIHLEFTLPSGQFEAILNFETGHNPIDRSLYDRLCGW